MTQAAIPGVEIWRGGVNTWEADEMGHMNVRFYVVRAAEGLVGLAAELGLPDAFKPGANATLVVADQHIRFLREAHPGAALHMMGGVVEIGEAEARLLQVLVHSGSGEPCATFQTVVRHVTPGDGKPFPWPDRVRERALGLMVEIPAFAAARSVGLAPVQSAAGLERAKALGLKRIALGAVSPADCDVFGRARPEQFIGRVSDGIPRLVGEIRQVVSDTAEERPARAGGAVLEYRLAYFDHPRAGDRVEVRSGLAGVDARTQRLVHWLLDPDTGKAWASSEAVAITFDLDKRKVVPISDAAQAALKPLIAEGLAL